MNNWLAWLALFGPFIALAITLLALEMAFIKDEKDDCP